MHKNIIPSLFVSALVFGSHSTAFADGIVFENSGQLPIEVKAESNSGLDAIYVLPSAAPSVIMRYESPNPIRWYRYGNLGAAYAEEMTPVRQGNSWTLPLNGEDSGYFIEEGSKRFAFWICDYSKHELRLENLTDSPEQECDRTVLTFTGSAESIPFFSVTGRRLTISRELKLSYHNLKYDEENFVYNTVEETNTLEEVHSTLSIPAVYTSTDFTLSGDRFMLAWGREESITSPIIDPTGVSCESRASQEQRDNDNEQKDDAALGGSAPCEIKFEAIKTDGAVFYEWQISRFPEFDIVDNSYTDLNFDYTFYDSGNTYVRFVVNNAAGTCEYTGPTYEIFIGESKLEIPNAFSPNSSPGVNDEWKVSYKSLINYECHIFNKWGKKLFSSTNPAEGWDGKINGKNVPSGVYYYVIKAEGADGIIYDRAGDINIIDYKMPTGTENPDE